MEPIAAAPRAHVTHRCVRGPRHGLEAGAPSPLARMPFKAPGDLRLYETLPWILCRGAARGRPVTIIHLPVGPNAALLRHRDLRRRDGADILAELSPINLRRLQGGDAVLVLDHGAEGWPRRSRRCATSPPPGDATASPIALCI